MGVRGEGNIDHARTCTYAHTHSRTHTHICTHARTRTHTHAHARTHVEGEFLFEQFGKDADT